MRIKNYYLLVTAFFFELSLFLFRSRLCNFSAVLLIVDTAVLCLISGKAPTCILKNHTNKSSLKEFKNRNNNYLSLFLLLSFLEEETVELLVVSELT